MSGYDWTEKAQQSFERKAHLPNGEHDLFVCDVFHTDKDGGPLLSRAGDPQILLYYSDRKNRIAWDRLTLSERAGWTLARLIGAAGQTAKGWTTDDLKTRGISPVDFADPDMTKEHIFGLQFRARVTWQKKEDGKEVPEVTPLRQGPEGKAANADDDIPM